MPFKMKIGDGVKQHFEVVGYYVLFGRTYLLKAYRPTVDDCHEWVRTHMTKEVECGDNVWKDAQMTSYTITKIVETRTTVERHKFEKK